MTKRQNEIIKDNLNAYIANFGYIAIEKEDYGKGFYIFTGSVLNFVSMLSALFQRPGVGSAHESL